MVRVTNQALAALIAITTLGIIYSLIYDTSLDTSNPLLANIPRTHVTSYFAQKSNIFNTLFVKKAWGWTSAAFLALYFTSPPQPVGIRRLGRWVVSTLVWALFASWFFGPPLFDRIRVTSGGQCLVHLPQNVPSVTGTTTGPLPPIVVPPEYCETKLKISPRSHPALFTDPEIINALVESQGKSLSELEISFNPRLYHGHDISGHLFLLTLSILFLVDEVGPSVPFIFPSVVPPHSSSGAPVSPNATPLHLNIVRATLVLIGLWYWMALTTSVYFHTVPEKISGIGQFHAYVLPPLTYAIILLVTGIAGYLFTTLVVPSP